MLSSQLEKVDEISILPTLSTVAPKLVYDISTSPSIRRICIKVGCFNRVYRFVLFSRSYLLKPESLIVADEVAFHTVTLIRIIGMSISQAVYGSPCQIESFFVAAKNAASNSSSVERTRNLMII